MSKKDFNQKLEMLFRKIEVDRNKVINKPTTINRYFSRRDGFEKTMRLKLDKVTRGMLADIQRPFYKIPLPPKLSIGLTDDAPLPPYLDDNFVEFYLDKVDIVEKKKTLEINLFYKENY